MQEEQNIQAVEPEKKKGPKFLLIRFSSIGDIVFTTPVIRCLKQQVEGAEVHYLTKASFRSIVEHNPYIDKLHLLDHSWELMMEELKAENYDYIIDLHHNLRTMRIKRALKKKAFNFYKLNIQKFLLTALKINTLPKNVHVVDRAMKTVAAFGVKSDGKGYDYFISKEEETKLSDIPASHHAGYVACVIGAAHGTKRWPVHKWKEFCEKLDHPIILIGGPEDAATASMIAATNTIKIYNACGKFKLNESADLVRKAKLVVANDTGMMHIAAAFKKPVISLWGSSIPSFGVWPYYGSALVPYVILQTNKLWCRPCSKIGYDKCPLGHFKCMEKINADEVLKITRQNI
jgi:ADP-heptose:LPS heptosyltransferase